MLAVTVIMVCFGILITLAALAQGLFCNGYGTLDVRNLIENDRLDN